LNRPSTAESSTPVVEELKTLILKKLKPHEVSNFPFDEDAGFALERLSGVTLGDTGNGEGW
jgi:hypothetical protein